MDWKKAGKRILFPRIGVLIALLFVGAAFLVWTMVTMEETSPVRIASYVLAFYTLAVWCLRTPDIVRLFKNIKNENRYVKKWMNDHRLRVNVTLSGNVLWNSAYAALQLGLGIYHKSAWFYSLAAYYASLAVMRIFLVRHIRHHNPGERMLGELKLYRSCGWIFLLMNMALSAMMGYMIFQNRMVRHHQITTIAMAAYTFAALSIAIINVVRYRRYNSPVISAAKAITLAAACVSMLTLENTMLSTFGTGDMTPQTHRLFIGISGGAISLFIIVMAIYMIVRANGRIKNLEN